MQFYSHTVFEHLAPVITPYLTLKEAFTLLMTRKDTPAGLIADLSSRVQDLTRQPLFGDNQETLTKAQRIQLIGERLRPLREAITLHKTSYEDSLIIRQLNDKTYLELLSFRPDCMRNLDLIHPYLKINEKTRPIHERALARREIVRAFSMLCRFKTEETPTPKSYAEEGLPESPWFAQSAENFSLRRLAFVEFFIKEYTIDINEIDKQGHTPLLQAIASEDMELITFLIAHGANVNKRGTCRELTRSTEPPYINSKSPIERSGVFSSLVGENSFAIFRLLLNNGADVNAPVSIVDFSRCTPLMLAVRMGNIPLVRAVIEHSLINILQTDYYGNTALMHAEQMIQILEQNPNEPGIAPIETYLTICDILITAQNH